MDTIFYALYYTAYNNFLTDYMIWTSKNCLKTFIYIILVYNIIKSFGKTEIYFNYLNRENVIFILKGKQTKCGLIVRILQIKH